MENKKHTRLQRIFSEHTTIDNIPLNQPSFHTYRALVSLSRNTTLFEILKHPESGMFYLVLFDLYDGHFKYITKETFEAAIGELHQILLNNYKHLIGHGIDRWWSYCPSWCFLRPEYVAQDVKSFLQKRIQKEMSGVPRENLSENEVIMLTKWEKVIGKISVI